MRSVDFEIPLVDGDTGPQIEFRVVDKKNEPVDLTDKLVNFYVKKAGAEYSASGQNPACIIASGASGICQYSFGPEDIEGPGTYFGELQIVGDFVESIPDPIRFIVRPKIIHQGN